MIPGEAVEAALLAYKHATFHLSTRNALIAALEAAAPHMLSHERQQTADAHRDAMVNAETVGKYEVAVDAVLALVDENALNGVTIINPKRIRAAITKAFL